MIKLLWNVLGGLAIKADPIMESGMLNAGMSERSVDYIMMGAGGIMLLTILVTIIGMCMIYGSVLIGSYKRMIKLKSKRLRRNWSIIFLTSTSIVILDVVMLFI